MDTITVPDPRRWRILGVLCVALFAIVMDNTIVNVALPTLARELHADTSRLQWIVERTPWSSPVCCSPPAGWATGSDASPR